MQLATIAAPIARSTTEALGAAFSIIHTLPKGAAPAPANLQALARSLNDAYALLPADTGAAAHDALGASSALALAVSSAANIHPATFNSLVQSTFTSGVMLIPAAGNNVANIMRGAFDDAAAAQKYLAGA
jgi:hypothetical protein